MSDIRKVSLNVLYQGKDISDYIQKDLINFSVKDSADSTFDDLTITLQDKNKHWLKDWICSSNDKIICSASSFNWNKIGEEFSVNFGTFFVDEPENTINPHTFSLKAISFPATGSFRDVIRTQIFKGVKLSAICKTIAQRNGLTLALDIENDKILKEIEQSEQSDFDFLKNEICLKNDLCLKLYNNKLVIFSQQIYEQKKPVKIITPETILEQGTFRRCLTESGYSAAVLKCKKPKGVVISATYSIPNATNNKILHLRDSVETQAEALEICKAKLREKNRKEYTGSFSLAGLSNINASDTIQLKGFGQYDGIYYVDSKTQEINPTQANFEVHRILNY